MALEPLGVRDAVGHNGVVATAEELGGPQSPPVRAEVPLPRGGAGAEAGALTDRAATESASSSCLEGKSPAWTEGRGGMTDLSDGQDASAVEPSTEMAVLTGGPD